MRWLVGIAALGMAGSAGADVTARYGVGPTATLTIEAADNGDVRVSDAGRVYLRHAGEDFLILPGPGGPIVLRAADAARIRAASDPTRASAPGRPETPLTAMGTQTVAGFTGDAWGYPATMKEGPAVVVSHDPRLAPLERAEKVRAELVASLALVTEETPLTAPERMAQTGAPLLFWRMPLRSVEFTPVPAARFALPVVPLAGADVTAKFGLDAPAPREADPAAFARTAFKRIAAAAGEVWLLTDGGQLSRLEEGGRTVPVAAPGRPVELCTLNAALVAVTLDGDRWTARRHDRGAWTTVGEVATRGERLVAFNCDAGRATLLTDKRVIALVGPGAGRAVALRASLGRLGVTATTLADGETLWLGLNAGEWGGGLRRIDRGTGRVTVVQGSGARCGEGLYTDCSPVNGLAFAPGKPGCVVAAAGLVHFFPSGALYEVCGRRVRLLAQVPYTLEPGGTRVDAGLGSVPFYGLATVGDAVWAVSSEGLYRIAADGTLRPQPLPPMRQMDGVTSSLALPGLALVYTRINGRVSVSGAAPLIAAR